MSDVPSKVFIAKDIGPSKRTGIGREVYPSAVTDEQWTAQGAEVRDEPFDAVAVVFLSDADGNHKEFWSVLLAPDCPRVDIDMATPHSYVDRQPLYEGLARDLEQHLGRTGLTILVSY
jgi:hypothetical protein